MSRNRPYLLPLGVNAGARVVLALSLVAGLAAGVPVRAGGVERSGGWRQWRETRGVVDVVGPRSDGRFVVAARGRLFLVDPDNARLTPYAVAYRASAKLEPYLALAGAQQRVAAARCTFAHDTVYAIEPAGRHWVLAIAAGGHVHALAAVPHVTSLNGIAFDTTGRFGGRLLVVGLTGRGRGVLASVDCRGQVRTLTRSAPHLEGGIVVAPGGFGAFGGNLIAADEVEGRLLALAPDGSVRDVVDPGQPKGGDIGVESLGIVPPARASAFLADRRTPGNANPGHDAILRLSADDLLGAGVAPGDLLATLEGGGATIAVRCAAACSVREVAGAPAGAHAEGSITFAP